MYYFLIWVFGMTFFAFFLALTNKETDIAAYPGTVFSVCALWPFFAPIMVAIWFGQVVKKLFTE